VDRAKFIKEKHGIVVSDTHFVSIEGAKTYDLPTFWASDGNGGHIPVVMLDNEYYLTQATIMPHRAPIPYAELSNDRRH
jgi:hypothetical protein